MTRPKYNQNLTLLQRRVSAGRGILLLFVSSNDKETRYPRTAESQFCLCKSVLIQYNQFNSQALTGEYSELDKVPEKMYPPRSSKTAFCVQPLCKGKLTQAPNQVLNIRLIGVIQHWFYSSKIFCLEIKIKKKCQKGIKYYMLTTKLLPLICKVRVKLINPPT